MKAIIAIIIIAVIIGIVFMVFITQTAEEPESERESLLHDSFESLFCLIGYLKDKEPEQYKKVSKPLDNALNSLIEAEKLMQEDEDENS